MMTAEELIAFEADIAERFNRGEIRSPIHLQGGCETQLIEIFKTIGPDDWIGTSWRSHLHCLLKGVPPAELRAEIIAGRSMTLNFPKHRIVSSAIVGGILPIALGIAWELKRSGSTSRTHVFVGDMTARTGTFFECSRYAAGHALPIRWIIESNGKSVLTDTAEVWGDIDGRPDIAGYYYTLPWPHAGAGKRVQF